jgi:hypothetical protein
MGIWSLVIFLLDYCTGSGPSSVALHVWPNEEGPPLVVGACLRFAPVRSVARKGASLTFVPLSVL